ncbi:N-formylglutamate amidohydrolase [Poseidonocella sedimentorum]|uniref:N-formylglutamate amidohydrolase n=1 Tax=Poseidonocella sedimentorum TaxID=871652 RepID=A0A1I6EGK5_9RHOB|nr:N-formylglutamate amidohydrolase [Poseidonocella sedimentorum]SFR16681.1 N-formylglutamate amidohydrolase [Poseidonocella sedimentorum]
MLPQSFVLERPRDRSTSVIFSSPHSGSDYHWTFLQRTRLSESQIRSSEDAFVDRLIDMAPSLGAPLLRAVAPRAYIDLNRAANELDPALVDGVHKLAHNPRVASGLGVIPRVVSGARSIYSGKISRTEAESRIERFWHPYHTQLATLIHESHAAFGGATLIDMHSMPHEAVESMGRPGAVRPDVVIGDRFGASASAELVERIEAIFVGAGFNVARNAPFAGAYIVQTYGRPARNQHAVQIEIDRSLYMNEETITPNSCFDEFRAVMAGVVTQLTDLGRGAMPLAAE